MTLDLDRWKKLMDWAQRYMGQAVKPPTKGRPSRVVDIRVGARGNGVWLVLENGQVVYREPSKKVLE